MTVQSGQAVTVLFTTRVFSTGVGTIADSLPTGTLYLNGTANGATVTVTNISGGLYKAAVTLPTLAVFDQVDLLITATVSSVTDSAIIWGDSKGNVTDASGFVTANLNGDLTATMKTSVTTAATAATPTVLLTPGTSTGQVTLASGILTANVNGDLTPTMKTSVTTAATAATPTVTVSGDFSATMKTSLNAATPAATLSNAVIDSIFDRTDGVESGVTLRQAQRLKLAACAGKLSGAGTGTITIRDTNDTKNRIVATVSSNNRTAVTLDAS